MLLSVFLAFLAAFGLFCLMWALLGLLLPFCREGWLLYPGRPGKTAFVYVYLWLRGMGIVTCPLILVDLGLGEEEKRWLAQKQIELCPPGQFPEDAEMGVEES